MKKILFKIKKGHFRSLPLTLMLFIIKFHRTECDITIPSENRIRLFGLKHGIFPGRYTEIFYENGKIEITHNGTPIYVKQIKTEKISVEYTARDYLKQIVLIIPGEDFFIYKYATTERINILLTPRIYHKLKHNIYTIWSIK